MLAGLPKAVRFSVFYFGELNMTFKKFLRRAQKNQGQASLEYFIIFSIIALLTIISLTTFLPVVQSALQGNDTTNGLYQNAVGVNGINIANQ